MFLFSEQMFIIENFEERSIREDSSANQGTHMAISEGSIQSAIQAYWLRKLNGIIIFKANELLQRAIISCHLFLCLNAYSGCDCSLNFLNYGAVAI